MTDSVTNALTMQLEYGDEELRKEIENYIRRVVRDEMTKMSSDSTVFERMMVNNAYTFNKFVLRAVKDHFNNPQQIY